MEPFMALRYPPYTEEAYNSALTAGSRAQIPAAWLPSVCEWGFVWQVKNTWDENIILFGLYEIQQVGFARPDSEVARLASLCNVGKYSPVASTSQGLNTRKTPWTCNNAPTLA